MPSSSEKKKKNGRAEAPKKNETEEETRLRREKNASNQLFYRKRKDLLKRASKMKLKFPECEILVLVTARRTYSIESYYTPKFEGVCTKDWGIDALKRSFSRKM